VTHSGGTSTTAIQTFTQRQSGLRVAVIAAALAGAGERRARQLAHHLHHRADQPLDDPAEMRLARRTAVRC
jgi:hypothetical protein